MDAKLTQYLHLPLQFMWFDTNELVIIISFYLIALIMGSWPWWVLLLVGSPYVIKFKRKQNRGFFFQTMYFYGFIKFNGYPDPSEEEFLE